MIDKIQSLMERRQELSEAIAQPEIIQDFPRYQGYLKELSAIEPIALHYQKLQTIEKHLSEARELLADPDLAPEAEQELRDLSAERENLHPLRAGSRAGRLERLAFPVRIHSGRRK